MGRSNTTKRGPLPAPKVTASETTLTQFSGLVPLLRYLSGPLGLLERLSWVVGSDDRKLTYAVHIVYMAFMVAALGGAQRLAHVEWLAGDAVLVKFLRLPRWPVRKVFSAALASLTSAGVEHLTDLVAAIGLHPVSGAKSAVLDFDSSVVVSFGEQAGAVFGYSGKGRNRRRHHPLVASVAGCRTVVHAKYRDGSGIDHDEVRGFMEKSVERLRGVLAEGGKVFLRADSGFWSIPLGKWLLESGHDFVFAKALNSNVKLMLRVASWRTLEGEDEDVQVTVLSGESLGMQAGLRVVGIRRRVHDPKAPPQGKAMDGCKDWRYQALITNLDWVPEDVWRFYNDRADCERIFKEAKGSLGMSWLVGHAFRANEAAFLLRLLAYNADKRFQIDAEQRARAANKPVMRQGLQSRQHRFYNGAGRLLFSGGEWHLRVRANPQVERLWAYYASDLLGTA